MIKQLAHHLKPVVIIGQHGLGENVINEVDLALDSHELIKVKLAGSDKTEREQLCTEMVAQLNTTLVQLIGRVAVLYRANPEKKKNRIIV